jgi:hypothetical protein
MNDFLPWKKMRDRIAIDQSDSDPALFLTLMYYGEFLTKLTVAGLLAAVIDDRDRHRYRVAHRLVRADGIGDWSLALDDILAGPASQHLDHSVHAERTELTQRVVATEWQHEAITLLNKCLDDLGVTTDPLPTKLAARRWFADFALLRNKTRGHGATQPHLYGRLCEYLFASIDIIASRFQLFQRPWAYLHRNLSGKYRVTPLSSDVTPFQHLKKVTDKTFPNGIYVQYSEPRRVELLQSDADLSDLYLPNGGFGPKKYELLSYLSGETTFGDSAEYMAPCEKLPGSESQGLGQLDIVGNAFTNLPPIPKQYITRAGLELDLLEQLHLCDRHPIVTLTGPGGTGKTSLALTVLHYLLCQPGQPYNVVIWFSARDIDLLPEGPKVVQPHVLSVDEFAGEYVQLLDSHPAGKTRDFFANELTKSAVGPVLFVFDNFETLKNPVEVFTWIDTYVRLPNKVLVTTRKREFAGDFPIYVSGMSDEECQDLIQTVGNSLNIMGLLTEEYCQDIIRESQGHPYVIKVLLGEVARHRQLRKVERIIAGQEAVLTALFERTYMMVSPASQRIFLTLCNWRSTIPEIALEAVLLRPQNERIDFDHSLDDLIKSSLVEVLSTDSGDHLLSVPLAAYIFGKRKLEVSPWKAAVTADTELLQLLGGSHRSDSRPDAKHRFERLFQGAAAGIASGEFSLEVVRPILEFIAQSFPRGWHLLADLYREDGPTRDLKAAKECLGRYLEAGKADIEVSRVWRELADVCRDNGDVLGEIHALASVCLSPDVPMYVVSTAANRVNGILSRGTSVPLDELQILLRSIIGEMERRTGELTADDCSRLAWLYVNTGDEDKARQIAERGLAMNDGNVHCLRLMDRLQT